MGNLKAFATVVLLAGCGPTTRPALLYAPAQEFGIDSVDSTLTYTSGDVVTPSRTINLRIRSPKGKSGALPAGHQPRQRRGRRGLSLRAAADSHERVHGRAAGEGGRGRRHHPRLDLLAATGRGSDLRPARRHRERGGSAGRSRPGGGVGSLGWLPRHAVGGGAGDRPVAQRATEGETAPARRDAFKHLKRPDVFEHYIDDDNTAHAVFALEKDEGVQGHELTLAKTGIAFFDAYLVGRPEAIDWLASNALSRATGGASTMSRK